MNEEAIEIPMHISLQGFYKIEAVRPDGEVRVLADWFPNLITNAGLDLLPTTNPALNAYRYCQVGSGSTAPAFTDTALVSRVAGVITTRSQYANDADGVVTTSPRYTFDNNLFEFGTGVAAGNLSEIGVGTSATGGTLFSRALILDGGGNPTTITVLADEILRVTYQLRWYIPEDDAAFSFTMSGTTYNCVSRAAEAGSVQRWPGTRAYEPAGNWSRETVIGYSGALGAITSTPATQVASSSPTVTMVGTYVPGSYEVTYRGSFSTAEFNGTIAAIKINPANLGTHQISFSPALAKDNTKTLRLDIKFTWGRYTP